MTYPPEPWYLGGSMLVSTFLVPLDEMPVGMPGRYPIRVGGRALVGVAFANYVPGGVLDYDELLVAVPNVGDGGARVTIPQIWVDSPTSQAGGRELWGIPKQLGQFERVERGNRVRVSMSDDRGPVASIRAQYGLPLLPGMRQLALPILQELGGRRILSHNRLIGRVTGLRASVTFDPAGPLGWLAGRRPLVSLAIREASIIFGMDVRRS